MSGLPPWGQAACVQTPSTLTGWVWVCSVGRQGQGALSLVSEQEFGTEHNPTRGLWAPFEARPSLDRGF